jgi:hypothetical protein
MVKFINIKKIKITLVFRHYWEKKNRWTNNNEFEKKVFGIFYRKDNSQHKLLVSYTFGVQLGWVKFWISVGRKK